MTDDWDFYFLNVDDKTASTFVDLGARQFAPDGRFPIMGMLRLYMNSPRPDGLSSAEEYDALVAIEDALSARLVDNTTLFLGRCTTDSRRDFFFYTVPQQDWARRVDDFMRAFPSYKYESYAREEQDWSTYFSFLYPDEFGWQAISNRRVCTALERNGDKLVEPREIDHWSYFTDDSDRSAFVNEAVQQGFAVRALFSTDDSRLCAQLWRIDTPGYNTIDDVTIPLLQLATKYRGTYDGWESVVVA